MAAALLGCFAASAQPVVAPQGPAFLDGGRLEVFVDGLSEEAMAGDHIAGMAVAIVQGGKTVLLKGYGMARQSPYTAVDPNGTLFRIGSLSKTFTWIGVMRQVEQGRMQLDAPVDTYLPPALKTDDPRFSRPISLADLMDHSAGYENRDIGRLFAAEAGLRPLGDYLIDNRPARVRPAGEFSSYSNYGAALAGFAAAHVAGVSFENLMERDIIVPLGMSSTTFREPYKARRDLPAPMSPQLAQRLSDGFVWAGGRYRPQPFEHILTPPAGSASTTAADMSRFMLAQLAGGTLDGNTLYGPSTATAFRTQLLHYPLGVNGWAHGFQVFALPAGHVGYGHGGATQFFFTDMLLIPDLDLGIFVSANTRTGNAFVRRFAREIVRHFQSPSSRSVIQGNADLPQQRTRYDGTYIATRRAYSGLQAALAHFMSEAQVEVTRDGYLATRTSVSQLWGLEQGIDTFKSVDGEERILFQFDGKTAAQRWLSSSGTVAYERVGWLQTPAAFILGAALVFLAGVGTLIRFLSAPRSPASSQRWQAYVRPVSRVVAALWIVAFVSFGLWLPGAAGAGDAGWPGIGLVSACYAALAASVGSLIMAALSPLVLAGANEIGTSWNTPAKVRYVLTLVSYLGFAALLLCWGALAPWNS
jgi:CubicO group peptidase (beta-lactamase class C family)